MGFYAPPRMWELEHRQQFLSAQHTLTTTGNLPDTPMWRMLERRFDANEARFTFWHPNFARLIRDAEGQSMPICPIGRPDLPVWGEMRTSCVPPVPQAIPEPNALVLSLIAVAASSLLWRKTHV